jgi:hypothetical protein
MIDINYETKFLVRLNPQSRLERADEDKIFSHFYTKVMNKLRTGEDMIAVWRPVQEELRESL